MTAISDHEPYLGSEYVDSSSVLDKKWTGVGQVHDNSVFKKLAVPPKAVGWLGKLTAFAQGSGFGPLNVQTMAATVPVVNAQTRTRHDSNSE